MQMMWGTGFMGNGFWMGFVWIFYVALVAFVFGIIFWWTKLLVLGNKRR
jgi:hypothetical protein